MKPWIVRSIEDRPLALGTDGKNTVWCLPSSNLALLFARRRDAEAAIRVMVTKKLCEPHQAEVKGRDKK